MDSRRRRSSILKKVLEEETADDGSTKLKRRISFSGKKSIRIFSGEEETQAWNNSYEESDNAINVSVDAERKVNKPSLKSINAVPSTKRALSIKPNTQPRLPQVESSEIDKENIYMREQNGNAARAPIPEQLTKNILNAQAHRHSVTSQKCIKNCFATSLYTTMDFINNTPLDSLHIENSVDVSLHDGEYAHPIRSFFIEEYERDGLLNARKIISKFNQADVSCRESLVFPIGNELQSKYRPLNSTAYFGNTEYAAKDNHRTVLSKENMEESILENNIQTTTFGSHTINIGDPVSKKKINKTLQSLKRKTICNTENMDVSLMDIEETPNGENKVPDNYTSMAISRLDCDPELDYPLQNKINKDRKSILNVEKESTEFSEKLKRISLQAESDESGDLKSDVRSFRQQDNRCDLPMDISMEINKLTHAQEQHCEENLSKINKKPLLCKKDKSQSRQNMDLSFTSSAHHAKKAKDSRKTIIFDNKSSKLDISRSNSTLPSPSDEKRCDRLKSHSPQLQNNAEWDSKLNNESVKLKTDTNNISLNFDLSLSSSTNVNKNRESRKTIIFDNKSSELDISKSNTTQPNAPTEIKMATNFDEACSKLDFTQPIGSPKATFKTADSEGNSLMNSNKKGAVPKVVIVRKICTPKHNKGAVKDLELQRFQRCINKEKNAKLTSNATTSHKKQENEISLNYQNTSLSSMDMSSPLFTDELIQKTTKKFNFRQLNDEIELGKLQIFPKTPKTSATNIQRTGCNIKEDDTEKLTCTETYKKNEKDEKSDRMPFEKELQELSGSHSNKKSDAIDSKVLLTKDINLIFSEANEMELEDTIFLTQTKLGDETYSHHLSKCSSARKEKKYKTNLNFEFEVEGDRIRKSSIHECEDLDMNNTQTLINENITTEYNRNRHDTATIELFETKIKPSLELNASDNKHEKMDRTNIEDGFMHANPKFQVEDAISEENYIFDVNSFNKYNNDIDCCNTVYSPDASKSHLNSNTSLELQTPSIEKSAEKPAVQSNDSDMDLDHSVCSGKAKVQNVCNKYNDFTQTNEHPIQINVDTCHLDANMKEKRQTLLFNKGEDMDLEDIKVDIEEKKNSKVRRPNRHTTFNFQEENQIVTDHSLLNTKKPIKDFNVAKRILSKQSTAVSLLPNDSNALEDSLNFELKQLREKITRKTTIFTSNNSIGYYDSPKVNSKKQAEAMRRLYEGTPHRSVIEFEDLEMEIKLSSEKLEKCALIPQSEHYVKTIDDVEQKRRFSSYNPVKIDISDREDNTIEVVKPDAQRKIIFSSQEGPYNAVSSERKERIQSRNTIYETADIELEESGLIANDISAINVELETSRKRSTINLTPDHQVAKKRHTQHFNDCNIDESLSNTRAEEQNIAHMAEDFDNSEFIEDVKDDSYNDQHVPQISEAVTKTLLNNIEKVLDNSPINLQSSRIPVLIGSANKSNSVLTRFQSFLKPDESNIDHSLDTIAIPRRATLFSDRKDSFFPILSVDETRKSQGIDMEFQDKQCKQHFEENPITISDVSVFYLSERERNTDVRHECLNEGNQFRESSEDNTVNNIAKTKRYMDLTCDSPLMSSCLDDIDKTRLSLVETLLEEEDDDDDNERIHVEEEKPEVLQSNIIKTTLAQSPAASVRTLRNDSAVCRKCKRCQETIINDTSLIVVDSFALPEMPSKLDLGLERLKRLRSKPSIAEVHEYWSRANFNRPTTFEEFMMVEREVISDEEDGDEDEADILIKELQDSMKRTEIEIAEQRCKQVTTLPKTFVESLETKLSSSSNWIFDYQMQARNLFLFEHRKIITSSIIISYMEMDIFGYSIKIQNIKLQPSRFLRKNWKPFSYVLDFQLKLEMPFNLGTLCSGSDVDSVFELLNEIDKICVNVNKLGQSFWKLVCAEGGSLIRELNTIYVLKYVSSVLDPSGEKVVEEMELKIEISNLKKICYKDIVSPPLYLFREDIQYLPIGLDFLSIFLKNPEDYLKI